jgi:putative membrane protein
MGLTYQLLFWVHMVALAAAGVPAFGMMVLGSQMPSATAETRPLLFKLMERFSMVGRGAIVLLLISGPLMFWLGWGGHAANETSFVLKMILVVVLLALVIFAGINGKRAEHGDREAAKRGPMLGAGTAVTFLLIMLTAAIAFK